MIYNCSWWLDVQCLERLLCLLSCVLALYLCYSLLVHSSAYLATELLKPEMLSHHGTPCPPALCGGCLYCALLFALETMYLYIARIFWVVRSLASLEYLRGLLYSGVGWLVAFTCSFHPSTFWTSGSDVLLRVLPPKEERLPFVWDSTS